MRSKEIEHPTAVSVFNNSVTFLHFLLINRMGSGYGTGAKGKMTPDGSIKIAINKNFFLSGGIKENQLPAIIEHEKIELTTKDGDPHLAAIIGEYKLIYNRFGKQGLIDYHSKLCNLYGGINDIRNEALKNVIGG